MAIKVYKIVVNSISNKKGQVIVEYILLLVVSVSIALILINLTKITTDSVVSKSWKKMLKIIAEDVST